MVPPMGARHSSSAKPSPIMSYPCIKQIKYKQPLLKLKPCRGASRLPLSTARRDTAYQLTNIKAFFLWIAKMAEEAEEQAECSEHNSEYSGTKQQYEKNAEAADI